MYRPNLPFIGAKNIFVTSNPVLTIDIFKLKIVMLTFPTSNANFI